MSSIMIKIIFRIIVQNIPTVFEELSKYLLYNNNYEIKVELTI